MPSGSSAGSVLGGKRTGPAAQAQSAYRPPAGPWLRSFWYAGAGLARVWRSERNFRVQLALGWGALLAGALARLPATHLGLLILVVVAVLGMETMNSALEMVVDLVTREAHPVAAAAKDLAAGAVLAVSLGSVALGLALFWPLPDTLSRLAAGVQAHPLATAAGLLVLAYLVAAAASSLPGRRKA